METSSETITENPRKRFEAELRVYYGLSQERVLYGLSVDMSSGGLFLKTEASFSVNERVMLSFTLPDVKKIVNCRAEVVWVNSKNEPRNPALPPGVGLQFLDLATEYLTSIQNLLKNEGVKSISEPEK